MSGEESVEMAGSTSTKKVVDELRERVDRLTALVGRGTGEAVPVPVPVPVPPLNVFTSILRGQPYLRDR